MSVFSRSEIEYLSEQLLGRLATVGADGQPHAVPVGFRYNPDTDTIDIGGHALESTRKFRDAVARPRVAFVVDDLVSTNPWKPRGISIRGRAAAHTEGGDRLGAGFGASWIQITPERIISWGIDGDGLTRNARSAGTRPAVPTGD